MTCWWLPLLVAPFAGSFMGVLIRRLPRGQPVVMARSACEDCGRKLGPAEMIPLISFFVLRGACRGCGAQIGRFHVAVELVALAIAAIVVARIGDVNWIWAGCLLGWMLVTLAWIDAENLLLPDALTLPLLLCGLIVTAWLDPTNLYDHAAAAAVGYGAFRAVSLTYRRLRGRHGLGEGDAKLLAAGGTWLGWSAMGWVVLLAALLGLLTAGLVHLRGRDARAPIPFGPALALSIWAWWLLRVR